MTTLISEVEHQPNVRGRSKRRQSSAPTRSYSLCLCTGSGWNACRYLVPGVRSFNIPLRWGGVAAAAEETPSRRKQKYHGFLGHKPRPFPERRYGIELFLKGRVPWWLAAVDHRETESAYHPHAERHPGKYIVAGVSRPSFPQTSKLGTPPNRSRTTKYLEDDLA